MYELADYFPIKQKRLDLILCTPGTFLSSFILQHYISKYLDEYPINRDFLRLFVCNKKYLHPKNSVTIACIYYIFQLYLVYLVQ